MQPRIRKEVCATLREAAEKIADTPSTGCCALLAYTSSQIFDNMFKKDAQETHGHKFGY
jgi:hypothetical protein